MYKSIIKKIFGHKDFRGNQRKIIESIISGRNTLVVMSTGSGKSLCYQLPAVVQEGMAIVISPLIALMKNQVDILNARGIRAAYLNSSISKKMLNELRVAIEGGKIKLLYISPETLNKEDTIALLQRTKVSFIAVDEAHCISDWGHDFRPEYRNTRKAIEALGKPPIIALTATATPKVQYDILKSLDIEDANVITSSFHRENLYYEVLAKQDVEKQIIPFIKSNLGQCGIIYCHSRKKSEELAELLVLNGINAAPYHAGLDVHTRAKNQDDFLGNKIDVVVATIAFGMGIDKANVRFIIHYDPPKSLEGYYQETGRAGRDGKMSKCIFFYAANDIIKLQKLSRNKSAAERESVNRLIDEVSAYVHSALCRTKQLLHYFGEKYEGKCGHCDNCDQKRKTYDAMELVTTLLKGVEETKGKYSKKDLFKILMGIQEEHFTLNGTVELPCFGSGSEYEMGQWRSVLKQLLIDDYIHIENSEIDMIELTGKGRDFLKKPHSIHLVEELKFDDLERGAESSGKKETVDMKLLEELTALRDRVAIKSGIKPYLVFQEKALKGLSSYYPTTIEQLGQMSSVGLSKAHKFGAPFVALIKAYVKKHNITPPTHIIVKVTTAKSSKKIHLIQQIDRKINLKTIAKQANMDYEMLIKELEEICYSGIKLKLDYYINEILDEDSQDDLYAYFQEANEDNIEEAIEELENDFSEEEIRLMHIKFLSEVAY